MRLSTKKLLEMFRTFEETIERRKNGWVTCIYGINDEVFGLDIFKNNHKIYDIRFDGADTKKYYLFDRANMEKHHLNNFERFIFEPQKDLNVILAEVVRLADEFDKWEAKATDEEKNLFYNPPTEPSENDLWKETLKNKEWNTITLTGVREVEVFVVDDNVYDLIVGNSQTSKEKQDALDTMWKVMDESEQDEYGSKKSFENELNNTFNDNDRALHLRSERFWSKKEATEFFKKNNIKIKRKYSGYIY